MKVLLVRGPAGRIAQAVVLSGDDAYAVELAKRLREAIEDESVVVFRLDPEVDVEVV